ncbi:hypothetical protein GYV61_00200 [Lactobacillus melliventris]|uniref:hypothetical protein n=1 Tax=Lactobacillus melliventris TaxID=1218507 RepID=UPI00157FC332|nr:hypothetical protein [Lactobacillus melliventris]NUE97165.1 hypothetical protein [Lactobacillus melliventris]
MAKKIITIFALAGLAIPMTVPLASVQPKTVQAKKTNKNKYGFAKQFKFPKTWRGKWYSNNNFTPNPMIIHASAINMPLTNDYFKVIKVGMVKGTKKYPWEMPSAWQEENQSVLGKYLRASSKKMHGSKWIILSPVQEKAIKNGNAFTVKTEKIAGKKHKVLFQSNPEDGLVTNQFFKTKSITNKYSAFEFKDMKYSKVNPR